MSIQAFFGRLLCCLIGWGIVGIVYNYTGQLTDNATILTPDFIDNVLHFSVNAIWFYLSFFIFISIGYLFCPQERVLPLMYTMLLCALASGCVYLLFPTTMIYTNFVDISLAGRALSVLIDVDSPQNLLPSLHVSLTLIVLTALWSKPQKYRTAIYLIWAVAICISVLVLKRHLFIDVVAGVITALAAGLIVQFFRYRLQRKFS